MRKIPLILFWCSLYSGLFSQELITDRPDFTESAAVVPLKSVQIEMGTVLQKSESFEEWQYPGILARIGLHDKFELRLGLPGWSSIRVGDSQKRYLQDLYLEGKSTLTSEGAVVPMAIIVAVSIPSGDKEVSTGKSDVGAKYAMACDLSGSMSLGANIGLFSIGEPDRRIMSGLFSFAVGNTLTDRIGSFIEAFAEIPEGAMWTPTLDAGFTYLVTPLFQLDATVGLGLNDAAVEQLIGIGASIRF